MSDTVGPARPTVSAALRAAAAQLTAAGVPSPRVDAELLIAHVLQTDRAGVLRSATTPMTPDSVAAYDRLVGRRADREPLQHILGQAPFRHLMLAVGPGVFVPRPETELLVDAVLPTLRALREPCVVDACSGTGALALAVADEVPGARVHAVERSPQALDWLRRNVAAGPRGVVVTPGDVTDPGLLGELRGRVDVVISNPPYVPAATAVDPEVHADPAEAVFAGSDGLDVVRHVIARAAQWLRPGGVLALEHDDTHGDTVPALLAADGRWQSVTDRTDLAGRPRYVVAVRV